MKNCIFIYLMILLVSGCQSQQVPAVVEKSESKELPNDYIEPSIRIKEGYEEGIIYDINTAFNIRNYFDEKCYMDKCVIYFELEGEDKTAYKEEGIHYLNVYVRDTYGNTDCVFSKLFSERIDDNEKTTVNGHYEMRLMSEAYDEIVPAYDENKLIKNAWIEQVLVEEGYYEDIEYCKEYGHDTYFGYICSGCGYVTESSSEIQNHIEADWDDECGSFSGQNISYGDRYCLMTDIYKLYHEPVYDYIHHDAQYELVHHPQSVVHHKEKYQRIWIED